MAKKSRKRVARYQREESRCMLWGLISIFDFRNGRSSQKLLADTNRGSKQLDGAAYSKLESSTISCEICNGTNGSIHETATSNTGKFSVKELIEEEMLGEHNPKKEESITNGEAKPGSTGAGVQMKKNCRWTKNNMSKAGDLVAGKSSHQKHKSCVIVEELYSIIHEKDTSCPKHGQDGEPIEDPCAIDLDEKWESTKVLMNHFADGNGCSKDDRIQPSKELTNALQVLNSNKDFFLKILKDPNLPQVENVQSSQDVQFEDGKSIVPTGSNTLEQDIGDGKQHGFFQRRFKGLERNSYKKIDSSKNKSKIVVLKPGPRTSGSANKATPCSSLTESPQSTIVKAQIKKSPFSFAEFKRKVKHTMRKEQHELLHQSSDEQHANRDEKIKGESNGMASSSGDLFFIDRLPQTPVNVRTGKLKDDSGLTPEKRVSNIYIEAKKHLAEILEKRDLDRVHVHGENPSKQSPRSLGRILAYSGYNSPICSPRLEREMRLILNGESKSSDQKTTSQVTIARDVSPSGQVEQESEIKTCLVSDKPILEAEVPKVEQSISDELPRDTNVDKPILETEILISEDSLRFSKEESQKESEQTESFSIKFSPEGITKSELVGSPLTCSKESLCPTSFKQEISEENEPSSSTASSTFIYKATDHSEDLCTISIATSRPSLISVLDPVFQEDNFSPPGTNYWNVIQSIQPQQVRFGEEISAHVEKISSNKICVDDKYKNKFVKDIMEMSGLTWDELLRRSLFEDHLVDPYLLDEVDFLPDLLSCDFYNFFDLIGEVLIEICQINFSCMISIATPYVHPESKGKDIFTEVWKRVYWYLKLESPTHTLDQIIEKDITKTEKWIDLRLDCQNIGIQIQEAIFEDLVDEVILSFGAEGLGSAFSVPLPSEVKESDDRIEA